MLLTIKTKNLIWRQNFQSCIQSIHTFPGFCYPELNHTHMHTELYRDGTWNIKQNAVLLNLKHRVIWIELWLAGSALPLLHSLGMSLSSDSSVSKNPVGNFSPGLCCSSCAHSSAARRGIIQTWSIFISMLIVLLCLTLLSVLLSIFISNWSYLHMQGQLSLYFDGLYTYHHFVKTIWSMNKS